MTPLEIVNTAIVIVGVPTTIAWLIHLGRKLQVLDDMQETIKKEIEPDLRDLRERFMIVEDRVKTMWLDQIAPANSPRQLNERGQHILEDSGIKEMIDQKKDDLLIALKNKELKTPYDAEEAVLEAVRNLPVQYPELVESLKSGAFKTGSDIEGILYVGGVYLRDLIFKDLGFEV